MKKTSTLTIFGYIVGFVFSLLSAIRYYVVYPDLDRGIVYVLIGGIVVVMSWVYNRLIKINDKFTEINHRIDAVEDILFKDWKVEEK